MEKDIFPSIECGVGKAIIFTYIRDGHTATEMQTEDMQDERQGVLPVRDEKIRQNSMGMLTGAFDAQDPDGAKSNLSVNDIKQTPLVEAVSFALTYGTTGRATFQSGVIVVHVIRKQLIRWDFRNF